MWCVVVFMSWCLEVKEEMVKVWDDVFIYMGRTWVWQNENTVQYIYQAGAAIVQKIKKTHTYIHTHTHSCFWRSQCRSSFQSSTTLMVMLITTKLTETRKNLLEPFVSVYMHVTTYIITQLNQTSACRHVACVFFCSFHVLPFVVQLILWLQVFPDSKFI